MESILIWFATGFSFAFGTAVGFFAFKHRPTVHDGVMKQLMVDRNVLDEKKVEALRRIADALESRV